MTFRRLKPEEIKKLKANDCYAADWKKIKVKGALKPERFHRVTFYGEVLIGRQDGDIETINGVRKPCGLYNSYLQDCSVGDGVYIAEVQTLARYDIADGVVIENVQMLVVQGETAFGNGTPIDCLNEGGGRELLLHDGLSAPAAYLNVLYRHDAAMIEKLQKMISEYQKTKTTDRGRVETGARIFNSGTIRNVYVGPATVINGAARLNEGTVASTAADPSYIGEGVWAEHFIILSGSRVDSGALLSKCFVGQGVRMGKQFSAENSCLFANSEAFHSEVVSLFAGPYTVTHHRSTLLIAGLYSFYNAGSGTNASNHMYRLGPLHQGLMERGAKSGSFSYTLWPSRIGAFSVVLGKHYANFDASEFPFSYINEVDGRTQLTPAMNLFSVGTRRDSVKWPARDRRKDPNKLDLIHFELFNPYSIGRVVKGIDALKKLAEKSQPSQELVSHKGLQIKRLLLNSTAKYYEIAVKIYLGQEWSKQLDRHRECRSLAELRRLVAPSGSDGCGDWADLAGLLAPNTVISDLLLGIREGRISSLSQLQEELARIHAGYEAFNWQWCIELMRQQMGVGAAEVETAHLRRIIEEWRDNRIKLNNMILRDAEKEFDASKRIGFGCDGDDAIREADFIAVRGRFDTNKFVLELQQEAETIRQKATELLAFVEGLGE